jgi:BirA family transcriptional regulator, biotin operon repressor / biotin---[acetyl-CoA-carboxylase] ligase
MVMNASCDHLSLDQLRRHLTTEVVGQHIYLFGSVDSTNAVLRGLAERGAGEGTVVFAEAQTAGRGRQGAPSSSPEGLNLYASVLFRPRIPAGDAALFTRIASLALSEAIEAEGVAATMKGPNDVVVDGRTVGSTLIEYATVGAFVSHVILGIGVNLGVLHREVDCNAFVARLLNLLEKWNGIFIDQGRETVLAASAVRGETLELKRTEDHADRGGR